MSNVTFFSIPHVDPLTMQEGCTFAFKVEETDENGNQYHVYLQVLHGGTIVREYQLSPNLLRSYFPSISITDLPQHLHTHAQIKVTRTSTPDTITIAVVLFEGRTILYDGFVDIRLSGALAFLEKEETDGK